MKPLDVSYDPRSDLLKVDGYVYAGDLFRTMTLLPLNQPFEIVRRQDGVITVHDLREAKAV